MGTRVSLRMRIGYVLASISLVALAFSPCVAAAAESQGATKKDETVHVYADATGKVTNTEIETTLVNGNEAEIIADESDATSIVEVQDDVAYTQEGATLLWQAQGNDVTYTASTDREVPLDVSVTYYLDGKQVDPDKLVGQEGTVKVRFDFVNKMKADNGLYVPFTAIAGVIFEDEALHNITVTNGKVIRDGENSIVVGYALPGFEESLDVPLDGIEIPGYIEVEGVSNAFEMKSALIMATPSLLDDFDASDFDVSGMSSSASALESSLAKIIEGSQSLTDALDELSVSMDPIEEGAAKLADGAAQLSTGATALNDGLGDLKEGAEQAYSGSQDLKYGADSLVYGIYTLIEGDGKTTSGLKGAQAGAAQLSVGIETLIGSLADANAGLPALSQGIATSIGALEQIPAPGEGADATIGAALASIDAFVASGDLSEAAAAELKATLAGAQQQATIDQATAQAVVQGLSDAQAGLDQATAAVTNSDAVSLVEGSKALAGGLEQAVSGAQNALYGANLVSGGLGELTYGLGATVDGLGTQEQEGTILGGANQVATGAEAVSEASSLLAQTIVAVSETVKAIADGASSLTEGLENYENQGISQLVSTIQNDVVGTRERIAEIANLGRSYDNFGGKSEGTNGSVKFVFEIEGIALD